MFFAAADDDHDAAVMAARAPQIIIVMPTDGRRQTQARAEHIDGGSFAIIVAEENRLGAFGGELFPFRYVLLRQGEAIMPLITVIIALIVVGVLLWLINTYIPMDGKIKSILNAVVVIAVVIWLLQVFGLLTSLTDLRVGR